MNYYYKVIPVLDVQPHLNGDGALILSTARKSLDEALVIRCINHEQDTISGIFKDGFDYYSFLSLYETIDHSQAKDLMMTDAWSAKLGDDL